jgi:hypothetical protein
MQWDRVVEISGTSRRRPPRACLAHDRTLGLLPHSACRAPGGGAEDANGRRKRFKFYYISRNCAVLPPGCVKNTTEPALGGCWADLSPAGVCGAVMRARTPAVRRFRLPAEGLAVVELGK